MEASNNGPAGQRTKVIRFERVELRPDSGELRRDGVTVLLGQQTINLLKVLLEARGEMVSIPDLLRRAWKGSVVEPNTLQVHISLLRKALGEGRGLLKTHKRRGYALDVGDDFTEIVDPDGLPPPGDGSRSQFIGRTHELSELEKLVRLTKFLSLVGPGGVGKTRLALELGRRLASEFPGGACVVDLAPVADAALLANVTAAAMQVGATQNQNVMEVIVAALTDKPRLMIFDNCELITEAVSNFVTELLQQVGGLKIIVTSQQSLGAALERQYRVEPLDLGGDGDPSSSLSDAAAFFLDRARALEQDYRVHPERQHLVQKICERLDGVPLAIEMAVARLRLLGIEELHNSLTIRLKLLRDPPATSTHRYPTLRAMLDWSFGLLAEPERVVFRRLAIFPSSFSLDAALAVTSLEQEDRWTVIDALSDLIDKSLVTAEFTDPPRYRMLETPRMYGLEKLEEAGEREISAKSHAHYFCDLFEGYARAETTTVLDASSKQRYGSELDNLRAALSWAIAVPERADVYISLAGCSMQAWREFSFAEGRRYLDNAVALISPATPLKIAGRALKRAGILWFTSDQARGLANWERAAVAFRTVGDMPELAQTQAMVGYLYTVQKRYDEAKVALLEGVALSRVAGAKRFHELISLKNLGSLYSETEQPQEARRCFQQAMDIARETGDTVQEQVACANLAELEFRFGDRDKAIDLMIGVIDRVHAMPKGVFRQFSRQVTASPAAFLILGDRFADAATYLRESAVLSRDEGGHGVTGSVELVAFFAVQRSAARRAAEILGYCAAQFAVNGAERKPAHDMVYELTRGKIVEQIGQAELDIHLAAGAKWNEEYALTTAMNYLDEKV